MPNVHFRASNSTLQNLAAGNFICQMRIIYGTVCIYQIIYGEEVVKFDFSSILSSFKLGDSVNKQTISQHALKELSQR